MFAGHERPLKLWHIDDPSQAHIAWVQQRAGSCRSFAWAGRGDLVCSVHENNYGAVQAGVYLQAVHAPQKVSLRVIEHRGAARDCCYSDVLSALVVSTQEGLISAVPIGRHLYDTRACRDFVKSKPAFVSWQRAGDVLACDLAENEVLCSLEAFFVEAPT